MLKSPESHWTLHLVGAIVAIPLGALLLYTAANTQGGQGDILHPIIWYPIVFAGYAGVFLGTIRAVVMLYRLYTCEDE